MNNYRSGLVRVKAIQFKGGRDSANDVAMATGGGVRYRPNDDELYLAGQIAPVQNGDWVIKGAEGQLFSCEPPVFHYLFALEES